MVKLGITLAHHDHAYVESRGGHELLTHLRSADARSTYRREAIERAFQAFVRSENEDVPDPEVGGLGLLVLQRSLLAAEDLGGLLHALAGPNHWQRLRTTNIKQLDEAFERAATKTEEVLAEVFRLARPADLAQENLTADEIAAFDRLRVRLINRWHVMLVRAANLWLRNRDVAKATMHGFPLIAGEHVLGPPPAGFLANGVVPPSSGRWALAVTSIERDRNVNTRQTLVPLGRANVAGYHRDGRSVGRLYSELADTQAYSIMSGHKGGIPLGLVRAASDDDERLILNVVDRRKDDQRC